MSSSLFHFYFIFDKKSLNIRYLRKFGFLRRKSTSCRSCRIYSSARNRPELARSNPMGLPSAKRYIVESYPCPTGASSTPDRWEYIIIRARDEARCFAPFALNRVALHRNSMQMRSQTSSLALRFDETLECTYCRRVSYSDLYNSWLLLSIAIVFYIF